MDTSTLVEEQIADGKRLIERLVEEGVEVTAAFWAKESDSSRWYLYIASSLVGADGGTKAAYRRIHTMVRQMPQPFWVGPFEVKAVEPNAPIAESVLALLRQHPGRFPLRVGEWCLGDENFEGVYIYSPLPVPAQ